MSGEETGGIATTAAPSRKRTRAATPAASPPQPTSQAETLQAVLLEMRAMREEQAQREAIHTAELLRRDEELLQLRREIQISSSNNRARGSGTAVLDADVDREGEVRELSGTFSGELGYKLKPDTFDGSVPLREFLAQFELISLANRWDDFSKSVALASNLRGKARAVLDGITELGSLSFGELKSKLEFRFGEEHFAQTYYTQFTNRKQKFGEDLISLGADIEHLSRLAYPECPYSVRDKIACAHFISALLNVFLRRTLQLEGITSLKSAVERAKAVKTIQGDNFERRGENFDNNETGKEENMSKENNGEKKEGEE